MLISDLGAREYCRRHKVSEGSLGYWRRRFEAEERAVVPAIGKLVPVEVVSERRNGLEANLRLAFPSLGTVEVGGDFGAVVKLLQLLRWEAI